MGRQVPFFPGQTPIRLNSQLPYTYHFLAGDTSYNQRLLQEKVPDGVSPQADVTRSTMERILAFSDAQPTIYLPSHDRDSVNRLAEKRILKSAPELEIERE